MIAKFLKNNWTDPVWSKVFATIIIAILSGLGTLIIAIYNQIPISEIYEKTTSTFVKISYFTIIISVIVLLSIIIWLTYSNAIKIQLLQKQPPITSNDESRVIRCEDDLKQINVMPNNTSNRKYSITQYKDGLKQISVLEGEVYIGTDTWKAKVDLPPFRNAPKISLNRNNGSIRDLPAIQIAEDSFVISINSSSAAGSWVWKATGELLPEMP